MNFLNKADLDQFFETSTEKQKFRYGLIMWFLLFLGYMLFCTNWLIMGKLEGGWKKDLNVGDSVTALESVNYTIPLARGLATIPVAWLIVKLSHKYAVVLAMFLNTIAFPLIFSPNLWVFIAGRMLMACGGTMLIIFIQPILSKFFKLHAKAYLSIVTPWAYVLGALLANLLFISKGIADALVYQWKVCAGIAGLVTYIPAFYYLIFGKNFDTSVAASHDIKITKPNTYSGIIREKECWFWIVFYSFLLVASVMVSNFVPRVIEKINGKLLEATGSADWKSLYTIIFYVGCLLGFSLGMWNKTKYQRKPFIVGCCSVGVLFWLIIVGCAKFVSNALVATVIIYCCAFLFAFFTLGVQAVILYVPHEYEGNHDPKRISIFYSYLWGIGYVIFSLYYFIASLIFDVHQYYGPYGAVYLITLYVILLGVFSMFIREPRPHWKPFPFVKLKNVEANERSE